MAEQTIAGYDNTFSLRPNRLGGCYIYFGLRLLPATGLEKSATRPVHRRELRLTDDFWQIDCSVQVSV